MKMQKTTSLPSWECGLKLSIHHRIQVWILVTPFVGVWIEISKMYTTQRLIPSLPSWECGLKYIIRICIELRKWSLPSWECGLKSPSCGRQYISLRSLPSWECGLKCTRCNCTERTLGSLPSWECGLKCSKHPVRSIIIASLPSWECGLKWWIWPWKRLWGRGHSLRGSVDWNHWNKNGKITAPSVTPFVGVWIEILMLLSTLKKVASLPSWEF